jgi:hypothetical protein
VIYTADDDDDEAAAITPFQATTAAAAAANTSASDVADGDNGTGGGGGGGCDGVVSAEVPTGQLAHAALVWYGTLSATLLAAVTVIAAA